MEIENIKLDGKLIAISEDSNNDETTIKAKFLICPLDESNLNGVGLKDKDLTDNEKAGLINQPVVAKVIKDQNGELDFSGHNMKVTYELNEDGQYEKKYYFDTSPIGTHITCGVEDIEIDGEVKKCITAECLFWTRYEKAISVIKRLGDKLKSSWEISYKDSYVEDGVKWLKDISWIGNCCLGTGVTPAYGDAGALEFSEEQENYGLAIAFTQDILIEQQNQVIEKSENTSDINKIQDTQGGNEMAEKKIASITDNDLYGKISSAINSIDGENYFYISRLYPYEFRAICRNWSAETEDSYVEFTYVVNSDETVSITGQKDVQMVFVPKEVQDQVISEKDTKIAELETELETTKNELSEKVDSITKLGEELASKEAVISEKTTELEKVVSELTPFKERIEAIEKAEKEAEIAQKKEELKVIAQKGGYISAEDLETSEEIKEAIDKLDVSTIKGIIADRVIASLDSKQEKTEEVVETSSVEEKPEIKTNLNVNDSTNVNPLEAMKTFLFK